MNPHNLDVDHSPPLYAFSSVVSERDADFYLVEAEYKYGPNSPQAEYARAFAKVCESVPRSYPVGSAEAEYVRRKRGQK
jgi:hypothetical protein